MYNVYGSQNEFVECVTREFILRLRSLGQNGPLRRITVSAVARIPQAECAQFPDKEKLCYLIHSFCYFSI